MSTALKSARACERREALDQRRVELERECETARHRLEREATQLLVARDEAMAAAESTARAVERERDAVLAGEIIQRLYPVVAKFGDAPRSTTAEVAKLWRDLATRAADEVDSRGLDSRHLALAFLSTEGSDAVAFGGSPNFWDESVGMACDRAARAIVGGEPIPSVEQALRDLEVAAARAKTRTMYPDPNRVAVMQGSACAPRVGEALSAHDAEASRRRFNT